ncbi:protein imuA [Phenylobacterium sp.]|uniref:ImuA family protein n=1 Tax=Phenylobacterium sp. TaxID=1871053 RepID=UPI002F41F650
MSDFRARGLAALKAKIAAIEAGGRTDSESLPFGDQRIDSCLPGGGLPLGRWHEIGGSGMEAETAAAPAAFTALMAAPLARRGEVVWVLRRDDLWAPGLQGLGFPPERLIQVCARDEAEALSVMEDALSTVGVAAVVGEAEAADLTAGRRLQLACEKRHATGFLILRRPYGGRAKREATGSAAATRWRIASAPSEPPPGEFGLGAPRFEAVLERCRGGRTGAWLFEATQAYSLEMTDVAHPLRLVAELGDRQLAPAPALSRVA